MQKKISLVLIGTSICLLVGCLSKSDKTSPSNDKTETTDNDNTINSKKIKLKQDCDGVGNYAIEKIVADTMIYDYDRLYRKKINPVGGKPLQNQVWIDAEVIKGFAAFLTAPKYDGVRFINIVEKLGESNTIILAPTQLGPDKKKHINLFGDDGKINVDPNGMKFKNFNTTFKYTHEGEKLYQEIYRLAKDATGNPIGEIDSLSKRIWIDKCVIQDLVRIINLSESLGSKVDGINIYYGAYHDFRFNIIGQDYQYQTTLIMVPTHADVAGGHKDDWELIKENTNFDKAKAYNHGQLCPNQCE